MECLKVLFYWPLEPLSEEDINFFKSKVTVGCEIITPSSDEKEELIRLVKDVDIIVDHTVPSEVIAAGERLKLIQTLAAGVDKFDFDLLKEKGIWLANARGGNAVSVAEQTFTLILAAVKNAINLHNSLKEGRWTALYGKESFNTDLQGKTIAIIGLGNVGRAVAKRAQAFGMRVLAIKRHAFPGLKEELGLDFLGLQRDLKYVLEKADFVVLSVPLTPETRGMIGEEELKAMKPTAYLVNVARGGVVQEEALYKALKEGWIKGACLDAQFAYPPDERAPSPLGIHKLDNVILSPHMGGSTWEAWYNILTIAAENVNRIGNGEKPMNLVDLDLRY